MDMQEDLDGMPRARLAIPRRSCDQCRSRKIACERASPCSNCISARLNCTYSTVASNTRAPRQRVLISAEYEKKISDISKGVDAIQAILQTTQRPLIAEDPNQRTSSSNYNQLAVVKTEEQDPPLCAPGSEAQWDHSAHIIDFIKTFVEEKRPAYVSTETCKVVSSLKTFLGNLEDPSHLVIPKSMAPVPADESPMPPLAASVAILRWAQAHENYTTINRMSHVLPLERFADLCRKIYFAVDDYNEIEFILANGYLYYMFCEHAAGSGREDYRDYGQLCEMNMFKAFKRLPLILPTSMEVIAAMILGAFNAVENSKASLAWSFVSTASTQCQTLGYHRSPQARVSVTTNSLRASQERLFWTVYRLDKGLALRFGRAPNIQDTEITLPFDQDLPKSVRLSRIQGQVYEQLYSPSALSFSNSTSRIYHAERLAEQLRCLISETDAEIAGRTRSQGSDDDSDPLHDYYLQCDLVCQSSLLTQILRAIPLPHEHSSGSTNNYVTAARDVFEIHHKCMMSVHKHWNRSSMDKKYINWAILNTPFVPFTILFTRVVQSCDVTDLARLRRFTDSLCLEPTQSQSITHPHQLYDLLCQAAQLYMKNNALSFSEALFSSEERSNNVDREILADSRDEMEIGDRQTMEADPSHFDNLDDWFQSNQQLMGLLEENPTF